MENNLKILESVKKRTGCKILLALKAFASYLTFPLIKRYLDGVCASSPHEARLGFEEFGGEIQTLAAAFSESDFKEIVKYSTKIIFNSFSQLDKFKGNLKGSGIRLGMRINPEYSEIEVDLYNPCAKNSRLGVTSKNFKGKDLNGITGLHFHAMCEQNSDVLERILAVVEDKFGKYVKQMEWMNFGGGHHITRDDYDVDKLCDLINAFKEKYGVQIFLEPGEAVVLNAGVLVSSVLDIVHNEMDIAILDTSAEAHMPDVLAMPYKPKIVGAKEPGEYKHEYRLGGLTCLAGDVIGDYSFSEPLKVGSKLIFLDMAHYTIVKNTTFNGISLPSIAIYKKNGQLEIIREFGYDSYKKRL